MNSGARVRARARLAMTWAREWRWAKITIASEAIRTGHAPSTTAGVRAFAELYLLDQDSLFADSRACDNGTGWVDDGGESSWRRLQNPAIRFECPELT